MKEKQWFQCQVCGKMHCTDVQLDIDDNLFVSIECPRCRGATQHLWVGYNKDDIYLYMNVNVDPRYYKYKTK